MRTDVCYLLKRFPRLSQTFVLNELLELERQGVRVAVVARSGSGETRSHPALAGFAAPVTIAGDDPAALAGAVTATGAAHVHAHFATWGAAAAHAVSAATGVPFSFTAHARDIRANGVNETALVQRMAAARFVVTPTEDNRRHLEGLLAAAGRSGRVVRLYNGVDAAALTASAATVAPRADGLIAAVGRLVEKKGFAGLVDAVAALAPTRPQLRCVIAGDGPERGALQRRVADRGLAAIVSLPGAVTHDETAALIARASVFAAPCVVAADGDVDALPTVILEAMALGTPVVSTALAGIPEMVVDGRSGLLVAPGDTAALTRALAGVIDDGTVARRYACSARATVAERFDLRRNVGTLRALLCADTVAAA